MNCIICKTDGEEGKICSQCKRFSCTECLDTIKAATGKENCLYCGLSTKLGKTDIKIEALNAVSFLNQIENIVGTVELRSPEIPNFFPQKFILKSENSIELNIPVRGNERIQAEIKLESTRTTPIDAAIAIQYDCNGRFYSDVQTYTNVVHSETKTFYLKPDAKKLVNLSINIA